MTIINLNDMYRLILSGIFFLMTFSLVAQTVDNGLASYYNDKFQGSQTASGESYDKDLFTAAHKTLPFGTIVKVTRTDNQKTVIVRINDRGPHYKGRVIELSRKAAEAIDLVKSGTAMVKVEVQTPKSYDIKTKKKSSSKGKAININKGKAAGLYMVESKKVPKKGYAVQIGLYSDYKNVLKQVSNLNASKVYNVAILIEKNKKGKDIYKVLTGPYGKLANATASKSMLRRKGYKDCFVINLNPKKKK